MFMCIPNLQTSISGSHENFSGEKKWGVDKFKKPYTRNPNRTAKHA